MTENIGNIFDIQRFSLHDGPGIRTTVFLKGCPLACVWCQNPESISTQNELMFFEKKCTGCYQCIKICPNNVHKLIEGERFIERKLCTQCGKCIESCYPQALIMSGRSISVNEIISEVEKDWQFYKNSGGGVTLSGGEPFFQPEFSLAILQKLKERNYHTAVETSGYAKWKIIENALDFLDLVIYDIKEIDPEKHKAYTGVSNDLILINLEKLVGAGTNLNIRIPLIPGYNDSIYDIEKTAGFLKKIKIKEVELMPYNNLAESKWACLGREYKLKGKKQQTGTEMGKLISRLKSFDIKVFYNGEVYE